MGENAQTRWWMDGRVGTIVIDNPPMNVLSDVNRRGMLAALDEFRGAGARVVVITGHGDRAFCGGADLKEEERLTPDIVEDFQRRGAEVNRALRHFEHPVIAAINGWTMGGGLVLALWCDIRIGSTRAKLGAVGVKVGLMASNVQLARLFPEGRARDMLLTGRAVEAEEALRFGLLSAVVPPDALMAEAAAWARMIAARPAETVARAKRTLNSALEPTPQTALEAETAR
jgi:enoyl-CoA hydratase